jgi:hypothetical protein
MEFDGFDWDSGNRDKCRKHGLTLPAIEGVFARPVVILPDRDNPAGEQRFRAIGTTDDGRPAFVVFTLRERRGTTRLRPISARYMHRKEVELYEKTYPHLRD